MNSAYNSAHKFVSSSNLSMSFDECREVAPDLVFKNINEIQVSADDLFKRVGDGIIVSFVFVIKKSLSIRYTLV